METLTIETAEYQWRYKRIRQFLEAQHLGALVAYSPPMEHKWARTGHVSWLTGWANHDRTNDTLVIVPATGQPVLFFAGLPFMCDQLLLENPPITDIRLVETVDLNAIVGTPKQGRLRTFSGEILAILEENGLGRMDVGLVGVESMPVPLYQHLCKGLGDKLKLTEDIVAELRYTKSPTELAIMRRASQLADLGFKTMLETAKPGMRGIEIIAEMERVIRREGADHAKYWMASGPPPNWDNARMDVKPHLRVLEEGDLMVVCAYVCYKGYWAHGPRVGVLRKPCKQLEEMARTTREIQDAGVAQMKAGTPVGRVQQAIAKKAGQLGWELLGGRIGHGIGLDYSEKPHMTGDNERPLEVGTTAIIHTAFALPGSGSLFVPLGDVCCVTDNEPELFMSFPRTTFVAGV